jgi:hypothetical protein
MTCSCHITGESAKAIAGYGNSHPHDPSDLLRCIKYWGTGRTVELQRRMAGRSIYWDRLLPHWDELVALLREEMETATGRAPRTYFEMKRVLDDGIACTDCDATGVKESCIKCKGTGRRSGGRCRPCYGSGIATYCPTCRGKGYTTEVTA